MEAFFLWSDKKTASELGISESDHDALLEQRREAGPERQRIAKELEAEFFRRVCPLASSDSPEPESIAEELTKLDLLEGKRLDGLYRRLFNALSAAGQSEITRLTKSPAFPRLHHEESDYAAVAEGAPESLIRSIRTKCSRLAAQSTATLRSDKGPADWDRQ